MENLYIFILIYFIAKYIVYTLWCLVGLKYFEQKYDKNAKWALVLGFSRLIIGLVFGFIIWVIGVVTLAKTNNLLIAYFIAYIPIRWLEWTFIDFFISDSTTRSGKFFFGIQTQSFYWRIGGLFISCLTDIPIVIFTSGRSLGFGVLSH